MSEETMKELNGIIDILDFGEALRASVADVIFFMNRINSILENDVYDENGNINPKYTEKLKWDDKIEADAKLLLGQLKSLLTAKSDFEAFNDVGE